MDWTAAVDIYCERTAPGFWNEPLNALSNGAFLIAALWAAWTARARAQYARDLWVLIGLAGLIGLGSFLFHTYATIWAAAADVLPIWIFVTYFVFVGLHRIAGIAPMRLVLGVLALVAVGAALILLLPGGDPTQSAAAEPRQSRFNGSEQYAPALLALMVFSWLARRRQSPMAPWVLAATLTFLLSLCLRTIDIALCPAWPTGTHFAWHLLNGTVIGLLLQGLIRSLPPPSHRH